MFRWDCLLFVCHFVREFFVLTSSTIGKWGRMHRDYLKEYHPTQFNTLALSGILWTYLADLNEQVRQRMETLVTQLKL